MEFDNPIVLVSLTDAQCRTILEQYAAGYPCFSFDRHKYLFRSLKPPLQVYGPTPLELVDQESFDRGQVASEILWFVGSDKNQVRRVTRDEWIVMRIMES